MVTRSELRKIILEWNQWLSRVRSTSFKRDVVLSFPQNHALAIVGVRRAGKSFTAANMLSEKDMPAFCMNFEDPLFSLDSSVKILDQLLSVFVEEFGSEPKYLILDEIQNIDHWEKWVRKNVDLKKYKIILTGSSAKLLSSEVATALTGRAIEKNIWPLSFKEFLLFTNKQCVSENEYIAVLKEYFDYGGFPEVALLQDKDQKVDVLRQYLTDMISKDILNRHEIRSKKALDQIVTYYLTNISSLHSYNSVKNAFGLNIDTVGDFTSYLQECFLIFEVAKYEANLKVRTRAPKKIYAIDTGIRNFNAASPSEDYGKLAENVVFIELKRRGKNVSYFSGKYEVDFALSDRGKAYEMVQVCYSDLLDNETYERETRAIVEASTSLKIKEATLVTLNRHEKVEIKGVVISMVPLYEWLLNAKD